MGLSILALSLATALAPLTDSVERGTIRLHLLQHAIGVERYEIARDGDGLLLTSASNFTDRGGRVQLEATLAMTSDLTPRRFRVEGRSYRYVNVDSEVVLDGRSASVRTRDEISHAVVPDRSFTIDGYAPFAVQMMLIRYWSAHGRPEVLRTLPGDPWNEIRIERRGRDEVHIRDVNGGAGNIALDRYTVQGVAWGRGTVWLDEQGAFAAAITRAGGLSFEGVREDLASALTTFVETATRDGIADLAGIAHSVRPLHSGSFALAGATLVDATGRAPIPDAVVIIRDGRLVSVGPRSEVAVPPEVPVIDVAGKTILPGLWDMHTHVTQVEWGSVYLASGVTTARDMGNEVELITALRDAFDSGAALGPRLLLAGLVDGPGPDAFGIVTAATPEEGRAVVRRYHDARFQQMKLYSLLAPDVVSAIIEEAHRLNMTVTGHVPKALTLRQAVEAGMDHIAHLAVTDEPGSEALKETARFLKERGTVMDPTQSWTELLGRSKDTPIASFQPGFPKIPAPLRRLFASASAAGVDPQAARAQLDKGLRIVDELHRAGVPIVAGTDGGIPGHSLHREIELYVEAGMTPLEAIRSATAVSARAMGLDGELGTVEVGKRADLVVLDANPLERISNIRAVRWVVANGKIYDASELWRSVGFVPWNSN
jgi:imidazolonepropionase-like amidohydrolase